MKILICSATQLEDPVEEFVSNFHIDDTADDIDMSQFKAVYNQMFEEYDKFPTGLAGLDSSWDADKKRFYNKYVQFAKIFSKLLKTTSPGSGYGPGGFKKVKLYSMLKNVDNEFPYGWK